MEEGGRALPDTPPYPTMRLSERMGHPVKASSGEKEFHVDVGAGVGGWGEAGWRDRPEA